MVIAMRAHCNPLDIYIYIYIIQFICILESQVLECSMGSFCVYIYI